MKDSRAAICVAAACITAALLALVGLNQELNLATLSAALFVLVGVAATLIATANRRSVLDSPMYIAVYSYVAFIGIGPLVARMPGALSSSSRDLSAPGRWPLLVSWVGFACLVLGYWSGRPRRRSGNVGALPSKDQNGDVNFLLYGGLSLAFVGLTAVVFFVSGAGGITYLLASAYGHRESPSVYAGFINMLQPGLYLLVGWALARARVPVWGSVALFLYAGFDMFWFGPLYGTRQYVIAQAVTLACLWKYCGPDRGKPRTKLLFLGRCLLVATVLAVLVWGSVRHYSVGELMAGEASQVDLASATESETTSAVYAPYEGFISVVKLVPSSIPYQWGSTFYESLTIFVPRKLWPSKPTSVADWLEETLYAVRGEGNTVATWPGELYLDFGIAGVIVGMIIMGVVCGQIAPRRLFGGSIHSSCLQGVLYSASFPLPIQWMWGGSNSAVWYFLSNIAPVLAVALLARVSAKSGVPIRSLPHAAETQGPRSSFRANFKKAPN